MSEDRNPFISISKPWRVVLVAYLLVYLVTTPVLREIFYGSSTPLVEWRLLAEVVYLLLAFLPILLYRSSFGWLHPLIFLTVFEMGKELVKSPEVLLAPLLIGDGPREVSLLNPDLLGYSEYMLAVGELRLAGVRILALVVYYAGFFLLPRIPSEMKLLSRMRSPSVSRVRVVAVGMAILCMGGALAYLAMQGGLRAHMLSYWGGGRGASASTGRLGIVLVLADIGSIVYLIWYALDRKALANILFIPGVLVSLALIFFLSGSRGSLFMVVVLFIAVWMMWHDKVPKTRVLLLGGLVLLLLGPLGEFRRSVAWDGEIDWSILTDINVEEAIETTRQEVRAREAGQGGVPVMLRVPAEVDYLYGKSYVGGLLFWVPRLFWQDKPHGAGYYNTTLVLERGDYGTPIPAEAEAYWNFGIMGVVVLFALYGIFHRWLADVFVRYGHHRALWIPYLLALLFIAPSSEDLTSGTRLVVASVGILMLMGALRIPLRSRRTSTVTAPMLDNPSYR